MAGKTLLEGREPVEARTPHGSRSTYQNYGCRCDDCRAGNSADVLRMVGNRHKRVSEAPHGTRTAYDMWGCRCEACKATKAAANRIYRDAHPARKSA